MRNERILFSALNLTLTPNSVVFLEGENGSGKTSLLKILCGFRQQDEGDILWNNKPISSEPDYFQNISYVGHHNGIKDELTVEENLTMMRSMATASDIKIETVLKNRFNIQEKIGFPIYLCKNCMAPFFIVPFNLLPMTKSKPSINFSKK